jgi:hypothetical protein
MKEIKIGACALSPSQGCFAADFDLRVLMNNNTSLEAAVTVRRRLRPDVHAHTRKLAIRRCSKVSIVGTGPVLGVQDNLVVPKTTLVIIVDLKVSSAFIEAKNMEQIMVRVGRVEKLGNRRVNVA